MRQVSARAIAKLEQNLGTEPILILGIQWSKGSTINYYADKQIEGIPGKIISVRNIESTLNLDGNRESVSIEITLEDADRALLNIINTVDIHKSPAYLYQHFAGIPLEDKFLIFQGEIVSEVRWNDQDSTLMITVVTKLEDADAGFSPEEGQYKNIPPDMVGKAWPMGFGTVIKAPALQIHKAPVGITITDMGIHDNTLDAEIGRLESIYNDYYGIALYYFLAALQVYNSGNKEYGDQLTQKANEILGMANTVRADASNLGGVLSEQLQYEVNTTRVLGDYPIALTGVFEIGGATYTGSMTKSDNGFALFTIDSVYHPEATNSTLPSSGPPSRGNFVQIKAGSQIRFIGNYPITYVVNIIESEIKGVYAYRQFEGLRRLTVIPENYYTVTHFHGATALEFIRPLSTYADEGWDETVYVSYKSSVGPKIQNVLEHIINTYTTLAIDDSIDTIPNFKLNFALYSTKNTLTLIQEICWQSKTAVWIREGKFYFTYLPEYTTPIVTLTLDDVIEDSLELIFANTESLITKMIGTWRQDYSLENDNRVIIRYNIERYGTLEQETSFYTYNNGASVESSMSFWIYRKGNTWKRLRIRLPLQHLNLENLDIIQLGSDITAKYNLANGVIPGVIQESYLDPNLNTCEIVVELPVRLGTKDQDPYYWPSGMDITLDVIRELENSGLPPSQWVANEPEPIEPDSNGDSPSQNYTPTGWEYSFHDQYIDREKTLPAPNAVTGDPKDNNKAVYSDRGGQMGNYVAMSVDTPSEADGLHITSTAAPRFDYAYGNYPYQRPEPTAQASAGGGVPGKVVSGSGNNYSCVVYPEGLSKAGVTVPAIVLQKNTAATDDLKPNSWFIFAKTSDGSYYFQPAIWQ